MKRIKKVMAWIWISFLAWICISVPVDTYVFGGKLKLLFIALANTTSSSPYSTDGQSNIVIFIVGLTGLIICYYYLKRMGIFDKDDKKADDSKLDMEKYD